MATSSTTPKAKTRNHTLSRPKPLVGQKERRTNPEHEYDPDGSSADEKDSHNTRKKPIPNYLKPTISSRSLDTNRHPVKKPSHNVHEDHSHKLLRRRSFDRPHSSLASGSHSSVSSTHHEHGSLNLSPRRSRDRPSIPRKETATTHRSSSSGKPAAGSRTSKSTKKSELGNVGSSKKDAPVAGKVIKKDQEADAVEPEDGVTSTEGNQETASAVHEAVPEIVKEVTDIQASDDAAHSEGKGVLVEAAQSEAEEVNKDTEQTNICPVPDIPVVSKAEEVIKAEEPEPVTEEKLDSPVEETREDVKSEEEDHKEEGSINTGTDIDGSGENLKAAEEGKDGDAGDVEEGSTEAENTANSEECTEASKRQVVEGKKVPEAPYNNVIEETRRKLIEERKNKVKALVGAFETVIDHESGSSK